MAGDDVLGRLLELQRAGHRLEHLDTGRDLAGWAATPMAANRPPGRWLDPSGSGREWC
ncbi:hypothetical protein [Saccharopolyspora gregorii]|uniref:hypothetical protein n=1 Tax=Saccharopolyspora gregorii TaxID=33914 RepID=UPI0031E6BBBB